jgi:lauroyl/myristoyl acyltransferase
MPKLEQARLWAEWALVRTAARLLRLLPIDVGASLAARLVSWAAPWTAFHSTAFHSRALRNLATAFPDWSEAERERVAGAMWRNTGRTFAETLQLDRIFSNCSRISFAVGLCGARVAGVYRPLRNPHLDRWLICATLQRRPHDNSNAGYAMRPSNGCGKGGRYPDRVPDATHARAMHAGI